MKSKLITFEGIDGSGKSTQATLMHHKFLSLGIPSILLREPGGTKIGENIRTILLDSKNGDMSSFTELFLYLAARAQITHSEIIPALDKGITVIMDRFIDSTTAYQGYARGLCIENTSKLNMLATSNIIPDITFIIDCDPSTAFSRLGKNLDRLESEGINFLCKVREGFLQIASEEKNRIFVVDGVYDKDFIHNVLINEIKKRGLFDSSIFDYLI